GRQHRAGGSSGGDGSRASGSSFGGARDNGDASDAGDVADAAGWRMVGEGWIEGAVWRRSASDGAGFEVEGACGSAVERVRSDGDDGVVDVMAGEGRGLGQAVRIDRASHRQYASVRTGRRAVAGAR